ncbi:hypothetical protein PHLCEN_2v10092 [Hermanssonia centrifuga]|uniref:Uncharacterized protein n=1 Tax=Hermanssonia centrifuga TaxID=98765 RepID=A0A2R6NNX8_9APHY|nr:hypothetical protein PHLCEN_2v10092 [Hermanssonia centrifuga]
MSLRRKALPIFLIPLFHVAAGIETKPPGSNETPVSAPVGGNSNVGVVFVKGCRRGAGGK